VFAKVSAVVITFDASSSRESINVPSGMVKPVIIISSLLFELILNVGASKMSPIVVVTAIRRPTLRGRSGDARLFGSSKYRPNK